VPLPVEDGVEDEDEDEGEDEDEDEGGELLGELVVVPELELVGPPLPKLLPEVPLLNPLDVPVFE
jgi:hypothetical protein